MVGAVMAVAPKVTMMVSNGPPSTCEGVDVRCSEGVDVRCSDDGLEWPPQHLAEVLSGPGLNRRDHVKKHHEARDKAGVHGIPKQPTHPESRLFTWGNHRHARRSLGVRPLVKQITRAV